MNMTSVPSINASVGVSEGRLPDRIHQAANLLHRPFRAQHATLNVLLTALGALIPDNQFVVLSVQVRLAGENGVGLGAVGQDAGAYVDEEASRRDVPIHVDVGAVHGHDAEVVRQWGGSRVSRRWRLAHNRSGRPCQSLGASGALFLVGVGVEVVHDLQRAVQPLELAGLLGAQIVGHALNLKDCLSQVKGHESHPMPATLLYLQLVAVKGYAPISEPQGGPGEAPKLDPKLVQPTVGFSFDTAWAGASGHPSP